MTDIGNKIHATYLEEADCKIFDLSEVDSDALDLCVLNDGFDLCVNDAIKINSRPLQSKTVTITENKETKILPDPNFDGLSEVTVITDVDREHYTGETTVVPKPYQSTILPTRDKVLDENIVVTEIPYFEVSNPYGTTVNIGG